jgi:hypothetical protein
MWIRIRIRIRNTARKGVILTVYASSPLPPSPHVTSSFGFGRQMALLSWLQSQKQAYETQQKACTVFPHIFLSFL